MYFCNMAKLPLVFSAGSPIRLPSLRKLSCERYASVISAGMTDGVGVISANVTIISRIFRPSTANFDELPWEDPL
jgi:hypothetical protein